MEHGQVRAILGRHADGDAAPAAARGDPTLLLPASGLRRSLDARPAAEQRALAHDYAALWARTFRTLARHLRGRPERAIALFAEEVYPFLRGDRRAARVERAGPHEARVLLPGDLPDAYHCGLLEGFVGLSGATAVARADGNGTFTVAYRLRGSLRLARAIQASSHLRLPLLAAAFLAALMGLGLALDTVDGASAAAVLVGVLAAQGGANLLHLARRGTHHPFGRAEVPRPVAIAASAGLYAVAALCAGWLAVVAQRPLLLGFGVVGLALGLAYARVRASGLGPAVAGATYGLLVPLGAAHAGGAALDATLVLFAAALGAPLGLVCAAQLFLDNLADRPLDEAGGQRTLAVRLPRGQHAAVVGSLLGAAAVLFIALSFPAFSPFHLLAGILLLAATAWIARRVQRDQDDPHALAPLRAWATALTIAVGAFQAWWMVGA